MKSIFLSLVLLLGMACGACQRELDSKSYIHWIQNPENGMIKSKSIGDFTFSAQFQPIEYMIISRLGNDFSENEYRQTLKEVEGMEYFTLKIKGNQPEFDILHYQTSTKSERQERLYYFAYTFQEDIYLEQDGKKIPCGLFHFERSYNLKGNRTFTLGFETKSKTPESTLVLHSRLLNTGPVKIKFSREDIPALSISKR